MLLTVALATASWNVIRCDNGLLLSNLFPGDDKGCGSSRSLGVDWQQVNDAIAYDRGHVVRRSSSAAPRPRRPSYQSTTSNVRSDCYGELSGNAKGVHVEF